MRRDRLRAVVRIGSHRGRHLAAACLAAAVLLRAAVVEADACPGDCDGNQVVAIDELIAGIGVALGRGASGDCRHFDRNRDESVSIDELLGGVRFALDGCPDAVAARGSCAVPAPAGLTGCSPGVAVRAARCSNPRRCLEEEPPPADLLATGRTADGDFALVLDGRRLDAVPLFFDAAVDPGTRYRAVGFAPGESVEIDPLSETTVRLIGERGLENFSSDAIRAVEAAVRQANAGETFAGATPSAAADRATEVARADPAVAAALEASIEPAGPTLYVGSAIAAAGSRGTIAVSFTAAESVVATENLIRYDPAAPIAPGPEGAPACTVNPAIRKDETTFSFQPPGCAVGIDCEAVKAFVVSLAVVGPIPDGAVLYTCDVEVLAELLAGDVLPLVCSDAYYSGPNGPIPAPPAGCSDGDVVVAAP